MTITHPAPSVKRWLPIFILACCLGILLILALSILLPEASFGQNFELFLALLGPEAVLALLALAGALSLREAAGNRTRLEKISIIAAFISGCTVLLPILFILVLMVIEIFE